MLGAIQHPNEANTKIAMPVNKIGLRPQRSDSGPIMTCNTAEIPKYPEIYRFTIQYSALNSLEILDSEGNNMFSESTYIAVKLTSVKK